MMSVLLDLVPWWGWLVMAAPFAFLAYRWLGISGALAVLLAGLVSAGAARTYRAGVDSERGRQGKADLAARDIIDSKKEDVRAIPATPAGATERDRRFSRWEK